MWGTEASSCGSSLGELRTFQLPAVQPFPHLQFYPFNTPVWFGCLPEPWLIYQQRQDLKKNPQAPGKNLTKVFNKGGRTSESRKRFRLSWTTTEMQSHSMMRWPCVLTRLAAWDCPMAVLVRCGGQGVLLQGLSPNWCSYIGRALSAAREVVMGIWSSPSGSFTEIPILCATEFISINVHSISVHTR